MKEEKRDKLVYLHIKLDTGEPFYIGKGDLKRAHYSKGRSRHWNNIVDKHEFDVIILEDNLTDKESLEREIYWIDRIGRKDLEKGPLVNFTNGGEGNSGRVCSLETKKKIGNKLTGRVFSEEWKKKISESGKKRKPMSEETRKKISETRKRKNLTTKHSEETKKKISESMKKKHTKTN